MDEVPHIEKFFKKIVGSATAMYEGTWAVNDDADARDPTGILQQAFGVDKSGDEDSQLAIQKGRVRTFFVKQNLVSPMEYLFTTKKTEGYIEKEDSEGAAMLKKAGLKTAVRGKLVLFGGHWREKEIDLFFAVHPTPEILSRLTYSRLLPNGEPYEPVAGSNETEPDHLIERLHLENALMGVQFKERFNIVDEKAARVNITI